MLAAAEAALAAPDRTVTVDVGQVLFGKTTSMTGDGPLGYYLANIYGTKWFTSATTSEMALTLARPEGAPEGSAGLALFRVHRFLDDGERNAILVRRLKDKLGTRARPTA